MAHAGLEERLSKIDDNLKKNNNWTDMKEISMELFESLREYKIINKLELNPNDMSGGSVNFYFTSLPDSVCLKLMHDSDSYYMSFFRRMEDSFDQQLTGIFKDADVVPLTDLDKFEEMMLDFCANEIYNRTHKETVSD